MEIRLAAPHPVQDQQKKPADFRVFGRGDDIRGSFVDPVERRLERIGLRKEIPQKQGGIHIKVFTAMGIQGGMEACALGIVHLVWRDDTDGTRRHGVDPVFDHEDPLFVTIDQFHAVMEMKPGNGVRFRRKLKIVPEERCGRELWIQPVFTENILVYLIKSLLHRILLSKKTLILCLTIAQVIRKRKEHLYAKRQNTKSNQANEG